MSKRPPHVPPTTDAMLLMKKHRHLFGKAVRRRNFLDRLRGRR